MLVCHQETFFSGRFNIHTLFWWSSDVNEQTWKRPSDSYSFFKENKKIFWKMRCLSEKRCVVCEWNHLKICYWEVADLQIKFVNIFDTFFWFWKRMCCFLTEKKTPWMNRTVITFKDILSTKASDSSNWEKGQSAVKVTKALHQEIEKTIFAKFIATDAQNLTVI